MFYSSSSLLTLSRVMVALGTPNAQHVNFRDSKLTRILQPSLSGNARMAVICCATPSELYLEETRSTLQFANRAKLVKTRAKVNEVLDERSRILRLEKELAKARSQLGERGALHIRDLEQQIATSNDEASSYKRIVAQLKSSILNATNGLFRQKRVSSNLQTRKRRFSDGGMPLQVEPILNTGKAPLTPPPPMKRLKVEPLKALPPSVQLELVQVALSCKAEALKGSIEGTRNVEAKLNSAELQAEKLRTELSSVESSAIALEAERDLLLEQLSRIQEERRTEQETLKDLRAKLELEIGNSEHLAGVLDVTRNETIAVEQECARLTNALQVESNRLASTELQLGGHIDALTVSKTALEVKLSSLEDQLSSVVEGSKEKQALLEQEKSALEREVDQLATANKTVSQDLIDLKNASEQEAIRQAEEKSALAEQLDRLSESAAAKQQELILLEEQVSSLAHNCEDLQTVRKELEDENARQVDKADNLANQLSILDSEVEALKNQQQEDHGRFEEEKSLLEKQVDQLSHSKQEVEESLSALEAKFSALTIELEATQSRLAATEDDNTRLTNELSTLAAYAETQKQSDLESIRSLEAELRLMTSNLAHEATQKDAAVSEVERLKTLNAEVLLSLEQTQSQLENTQQNVESLSSESSILKGSIQSLEEKCASLTTERNECIEECKTATSEMENALNRAEEQESKLSMLTAKLVECEESRVALETKLSQSTADEKSIKQSLSEALAELDRYQKTKDEMQDVIDDLKGLLADSELELERLKTDLASALVQVAQATLALEHSNEEKCDHMQSVDELREECTVLRKERDDLRDDLQKLQSRVEGLTENLASMQAEKSDVDTLVEKCRLELLALESKLETVTAKYAGCSAELDSVQSVVASLKEHNVDLELTLQNVRNEKLVHEQTINALKAQVATSAHSLQESEVECRRLVAELSESESRKAEMQEDLSKAYFEMQDSSQTYAERIKSLLTEVETINSQLTQSELTSRERLHDSQTLSSKLTTANEALRVLECKVEEIREDHSKTLESYDVAKRDLEDAQKRILQCELTEAENSKELSSLREELSLMNTEIASIRAVNSALESSLKEKDLKIKEQKEVIMNLEEQCEDWQQEIRSLKSEKDDFSIKIQHLRSELASIRVENADLTKELLSSHDLLESRNSKLVGARSSINELEDQLSSMRDMLHEKHAKVDEQALRIAELEQNIPNSDYVDSHEEELTSLKETVANLNVECVELKNLLSESNDTIAAARENEVALQSEVEVLHERLRRSQEHIATLEKSLKSMEKNLEVLQSPNVETLIAERNDLVASLEKEKADRARSESDLKRRMGDEQRALLKEAETSMQSLYDRLSKVEKEAYATREQNQELRDQATKSEERFRKLEYENSCLQNSLSERQGREAKEVHRLTRELDAMKKQEQASRQSVLELKKQLRECTEEINTLATTNRNLQRLEGTIDGLQSELAAAKGFGKENDEAVLALKDQILQKDERIKYLEERKFTKHHAAHLTKLKVGSSHVFQTFSLSINSLTFLARCRIQETNISLQNEVKRLRQVEEVLSAASAESTDTTKLRFDNHALESKLRKAASHCQELEDQKNLCLSVLRRNQLPVENADLVNAIVSLCDRVASDSNRRGSTAADLERLNSEKSVLQATIFEQNQKLEGLETVVADLRATKEANQGRHVAELERKVRNLEEEIIALIEERKEEKKKLYQLMKENKVLRSKALDDTTFELEQLKQRHAEAARSNTSPHRTKRTDTPNAPPVTKQGSATKPPTTPSRLQAKTEGRPPLSKLPLGGGGTPGAKNTPFGASSNNENDLNRYYQGSNQQQFALDNIMGSVTKGRHPPRVPRLGESNSQPDKDDPAECKQS